MRGRVEQLEDADRARLARAVGVELARHTRTQCNAIQCNAMQCNAMQCNAMCSIILCNVIQRHHVMRRATTGDSTCATRECRVSDCLLLLSRTAVRGTRGSCAASRRCASLSRSERGGFRCRFLASDAARASSPHGPRVRETVTHLTATSRPHRSLRSSQIYLADQHVEERIDHRVGEAPP